jgi:hypothetical protein
MWPALKETRASLANYLVHDAQPINDMATLVDSMITGWTMTVANGFVYVKNGLAVAITGDQLTMLGLHVLWTGMGRKGVVVAGFVQMKVCASVEPHPFWKAMYSMVAWLLTPPDPIRDLLEIGRPDLLEHVRRGYLEWIARVKNPALIERALDLLTAGAWELSTRSAIWGGVAALSKSACIQMLSTRSSGLNGVARSATIATPTIVLNQRGELVVHPRDQRYIIVMLLFAHPFLWSVRGVPADAPIQFHQLVVEQPFLFDPALACPAVPFDDLPI